MASHTDRALPLATEALPAALHGRIGYLLNRPATLVRERAQVILKPLRLIPPHFGVLSILKKEGPMTQKALGEALKVDPATMVWLIDHLEKERLVRRGEHPKDRRAHLVELSRSGRAAQARAARRLDQLEDEFLAPLSKTERHDLKRLLGKLFRNVPTQCIHPKLFEGKHA
jgi:DNA-binding MarR family transcriptional regulator